MSANSRAKHLSVAAAILIAIAVVTAPWTSPATAEAENTPAVRIMWVDARTQDLKSDSVHVNIPIWEIQDGQFCQGYGVVHRDPWSPPYYFEWSGQFDDSHAQQGPLGPKQIVNGYIDSERPNWLQVDVWADDTKTDSIGSDWVALEIGEEFEYNEACEV